MRYIINSSLSASFDFGSFDWKTLELSDIIKLLVSLDVYTSFAMELIKTASFKFDPSPIKQVFSYEASEESTEIEVRSYKEFESGAWTSKVESTSPLYLTNMIFLSTKSIV